MTGVTSTKVSLACTCVCLTAACGSPSGGSAGAGGSASVSGTLLGKTFAATDAASYSSGGSVTVVLSDAAGVCSEVETSGVKPGSSALAITLPVATASVTTYTAVEVQFAEFDATCNSPAGESGSGSVTITAATASSLSGTFSFYLNADTITGSFVAPTCTPGTGAPVCK
jgi:hypothetical protein